MNRSEKVFYKEIEPHIIRNKERNRRRSIKNTLYDYKERDKNRYKMAGSLSIIVLIKAGIPYDRAKQLLNR